MVKQNEMIMIFRSSLDHNELQKLVDALRETGDKGDTWDTGEKGKQG